MLWERPEHLWECHPLEIPSGGEDGMAVQTWVLRAQVTHPFIHSTPMSWFCVYQAKPFIHSLIHSCHACTSWFCVYLGNEIFVLRELGFQWDETDDKQISN